MISCLDFKLGDRHVRIVVMSRVYPPPSTYLHLPLVTRIAPPAVVTVDTLWSIGKKAVA